MPLSLRRLPGVPSFIQTPSFAAIFGGAGYVTSCGDYENGAGIATAWSITYLVLNVNKAIRSKRPIPILMLTAVAGNGFIYGQKYFREYFA
ncbi:hypothetical protein K7432_000435 [Basidiobolus ranarum]|uniref:Uncharacterized protein n=1 Tax=Basidiobolus ranarum TaxID=34480 RepID=A0ABR2WBA7_9FUNG